MLASRELASSVVKCKIHATEHGSDHCAIETTFDVDVPEHAIQPRLLLKNAPWNAIRERVAHALERRPASGGVQMQNDRLMHAVSEAVYALTQKPSRAHTRSDGGRRISPNSGRSTPTGETGLVHGGEVGRQNLGWKSKPKRQPRSITMPYANNRSYIGTISWRKTRTSGRRPDTSSLTRAQGGRESRLCKKRTDR